MTEEYVNSTISIDITEFSEKYIDGKTVTFYICKVFNHVSKQDWSLEKRYSEFESLYKNLIHLLPNIPPIPGKSLFKVTAYDALTKRRIQLEAFLKECSTRKDIQATEYFKNFLEIDKHSPELSYNSATKISEFTDLPLGVRDFFYYKEKNMIFIVACDMNIASRVDAYITNVNLPWEKKTDAHISVGAVFAFQIVNIKGEYKLDKKWAKSFPEQTGVVNFEKESCLLQVGLDSGTVIIYKTSEDNHFVQYDELTQFKPHTGRVMGVAVDSQKGYVYSCSSDKKFCLTDLNNGFNSIEIATSQAGYTNLYIDKKNERLFLTNEAGLVSVFLTNSSQPEIVNIIQTHTSNVIRGFHIDLNKYYIFTATNKGDISVLDLNLPGKEKLIKELTYFGGNVEIRIVRYNAERNELMTGDQNGKVTIWSLKTGQSIYAWQAHTGAITQMYYDNENMTLVTASKDKKICFWKLPEKWVNDEIEKFEKNEIKNINDSIALMKMQKQLTKMNDGDDSSDDSLSGWDIRP